METKELISALEKVVGSAHVKFGKEDLQALENSTMPIKRTVLALVEPGDRDELQKCVLLLNEKKIQFHVVSAGKNWGYGSQLPPSIEPTIILKLTRLNRIIHFSEELGTITMEPGVTFLMLQEKLAESGGKWVFNSFGGSGHASIIANTLERGLGPGLIGEKILSSCEMEVLLADGTLLNTGFERYGANLTAGVFRDGPGPALQSLFCQSSFGIVTKMTFWLARRPKYFEVVAIKTKTWEGFSKLLLGIQELKRDRVFDGFVPVYNVFRILPYMQTFPWEQYTPPLSAKDIENVAKKFHLGPWNVLIPVFGYNTTHVRAQKKAIRKVFRGMREIDCTVVNKTLVRLSKLIDPIHKRIYGSSLYEQLNTLLNKSFFLGNLLEKSVSSVYWRKKPPYPKQMNPDNDKAGLWWMSVIAPFKLENIEDAIKITNKVQNKHNIEPAITFQVISEKAVIFILSHCWDRELPGEDEKAMKIYEELSETLHDAGYLPYRLGLHSMDFMNRADEPWIKVIKLLKSLFDPNHLLSMGRYDHSDSQKDPR